MPTLEDVPLEVWAIIVNRHLKRRGREHHGPPIVRDVVALSAVSWTCRAAAHMLQHTVAEFEGEACLQALVESDAWPSLRLQFFNAGLATIGGVLPILAARGIGLSVDWAGLHAYLHLSDLAPTADGPARPPLTGLCVYEAGGCLPEGLWEQRALTSLVVAKCSLLQAVPDGLTQLRSLTSLRLAFCSAVRSLPEGLGQLGSLTTLTLQVLESLVALPESIGQLGALTTLVLHNCNSLHSLPESIGELASLASLEIEACCRLTSLPESTGNLAALRTLNLAWCTELRSLPESLGGLGALTTLDLTRCEVLESLPESVGRLASLTTLTLAGCEELTALPASATQLSSLATLDLRCCIGLEPCEVAEELSGLPHLALDLGVGLKVPKPGA